MTTYPKISIVTASYNHGKYIEKTIQSIVHQCYPNLEYIIIDGGSTDNTLDIIRQYEHHISYWVSEKDSGVMEAINKGSKKATGEIMAFINSDDLLHPNALFTVAEIFTAHDNVKWLLGASTVYDEAGRAVFVKQSKGFTKFHYMLHEFEWIQLESTFWRKSLWDEAGGYFVEDLKYAGDFDLWIRFFHLTKLYITDALIGGFRLRSGNQLSIDNIDKYINEVKQILANQQWDNETILDLKKLQQIILTRKLLRRSMVFNYISLNRKLDARYNKIMNAPPRLTFDGKSQRFTFNN
jgi:glycosyltransferase involved in cell wall biosynthesis